MDGSQFDLLLYLAKKHVFRFLNLGDLARCRAMCRLFKFYAADQGQMDELAVLLFYVLPNHSLIVSKI